MPIIILGAVAFTIFIIQNYVYKRLWNKGLSFDIRFSIKEAFEGDKLHLREELTNKKFLPLPWVYIRVGLPSSFIMLSEGGSPIGSKGIISSLYSIMSYTAIRKYHVFICKRRGIYNLRSVNVSTSNLLHNRKYNMVLRLNRELLVFPKILDDFHNLHILYKHLDAAILSNRLINPDPFEFKGIRDYVSTDALSSINFKASAVSQKLMVNIYAPNTTKRLVLVLNLEASRPSYPLELYEQAIRLTATLARHYINTGVQLGFTTNGRDSVVAEPVRLEAGTSTAHLYKIYECLARLSLTYKCEPLTEYISNLTDREQVYLFISPLINNEMLYAFEEMQSRGVDAYMVVPFFSGTDVVVPEKAGVFAWDATIIEEIKEDAA